MITVTPATAARRLLAPDWAAATISQLRSTLGFSKEVANRTQIFPADPWHRVVVHNIPLRDVQEGPKGSWFEQNRASMQSDWDEFNPLAHSQAGYCSKAIWWPISNHVTDEELKAKGSISMRIAFDISNTPVVCYR